MRLFLSFCYLRAIIGPILALWAFSQVGCEKANPNYCPPEEVCVVRRCLEHCPFDAAPSIDAGIDGPIDGALQQPTISTCQRQVLSPPDEGVTTDRQVVVTCIVANAGRCSAVVTPTNGNPPPPPFSFTLSPSGQGDEWVGQPFLPALGGNGIRVTCEGDQGTTPTKFPPENSPPFMIRAMTFTLSGVGVEVLGSGRYRLPNRTTQVTWAWNLPGEPSGTNCQGTTAPAVGTFFGGFDCPAGSLGPRSVLPANGPAVTLLFTMSSPAGSLGYRGTAQLEVPGS